MAGNKTKPEKYLYLQPPEAKKFIVAAYDFNIRIGLMMDITLNGGLRISETLNIRKSDIDFTKNKITIDTLKRREGKKLIADILFPETTMNICKKIVTYLDLSPDERLFPFTRQWAWRCFKNILKKLGMSNLYSPHALRHAHGIMVAEITHGDVIKIAKRLRHSSLNHVHTYTHLTDSMQKEIIEGINQMNKGLPNNE